MKIKFYSPLLLKYCFFISFFFFSISQTTAQAIAEVETISRSEFVNMNSTQKAILIHKWNNASWQNEIPKVIDQKVIAYYKEHNIDDRIYQKYKILFKTMTNEKLPLQNRINACYFDIENYDASLFPVEIAKEILDELILKSK